MASAVVASWSACIKDLQQLIDRAAEPPAGEGAALTRRIQNLFLPPPLPNAAWKKLVQDVQVMLKDVHRLIPVGG
jgi:hypothetical protein